MAQAPAAQKKSIFDMCKQDVSWFKAAAAGDLGVIVDQLAKKAQSRDPRATSEEAQVYHGFTALHYAVFFGHYDIVKVLDQYEMHMLIEEDFSIQAPGFAVGAKYKITAGCNVFSLALLRKQIKIIKYLISKIHADAQMQKDIIGVADDAGMCTVQYATLCSFPEAALVYDSPMFKEGEFSSAMDGDMTVVMNACYFGRKQVAQWLLETEKDKKYQEFLYKMCLNPDSSGATCLQVAISEVNYKKYGTSEEEKQEVHDLLVPLVRRALGYAHYRQDEEEWKQLFDDFHEEGITEIPYNKDGELKDEAEEQSLEDEESEEEKEEEKGEPKEPEPEAEA